MERMAQGEAPVPFKAQFFCEDAGPFKAKKIA
jgi:hypothetical protein